MLEIKNDLIICRENELIPTILTIENGAQLNLYGGNTITVREGNKLIIQNGSSLHGGLVDPNFPEYNHASIHLETDGELHVLDGSYLEFVDGLTITMDQGAKFINDDSELKEIHLHLLS